MLSAGWNFEILRRCLSAALWNFKLNCKCTSSLDIHDIQIFILWDSSSWGTESSTKSSLPIALRHLDSVRVSLLRCNGCPGLLYTGVHVTSPSPRTGVWQCFQRRWPLAPHLPPTTLPYAPDEGGSGVKLLVHVLLTCRALPQTVHFNPGQQAHSVKLSALHGL